MKKALLIAGFIVSGPAFAQDAAPTPNCPNGSTTCASATSNSGSQASNTGGNLTITSPLVVMPETRQLDTTRSLVEQSVSGTQTVRNVPSVGGPPLVSSNDTCMGSTSGSVNVAGFGAALGSTWTDDNCKMLKNSRELWNMGMKAAALALMCNDPANREALELTGFACPQRRPATPVAAADVPTDPHVRDRLGLPQIK